MIRVLRAVDKANGYCFGDLEERNLQAMMSAAVGADFHFNLYPSQIPALTHCDSFVSTLTQRTVQTLYRPFF